MKLKINLAKTLSIRAKKTLWVLGLHAFALIIFFVLVDIFLGGLVFYKYVFLAENAQPKAAEDIIKFDNTAFQSVIVELQSRGQND